MANLARDFREQHPGAAVVRRTRNSMHLDAGDNRRLALIRMDPLHYGPDAALEVDTAWEAANVDGYQWRMVKADCNAYAKANIQHGDGIKYVEPESGEHVIFQPESIRYVDEVGSEQFIATPQNVTAQADDDKLLWPNAMGTGRHFRWRCENNLLEKLFIVDAPVNLPPVEPWLTGAVSLQLAFYMKYTAGVLPWVDGVPWTGGGAVMTQGSIEFRDAGGNVLWLLAPPLVYDSAGEQTLGVTRLLDQGGQFYAQVRVPMTWVDAATFPIYVDPTLTLQPDAAAGIDVRLFQGSPNNNYGTDARLNIVANSGGFDFRSIIKFDLSDLPDGATIDSATLSVFTTSSYEWESTTLYAHRILSGNGGWTESGARWNNIDGTNAWAGSAGCSTSGTDYAATASGSDALIANEASGTEHDIALDLTEFGYVVANNYGWVLFEAATPYAPWIFASSDHDTAAYRPKLVVEYAEGGGATYTLTAEAGSYAVAGNDAGLLASRLLTAEAGAYTVTGNDAGLLASRLLSAEPGTYSLTGNDAALLAGRLLEAAAGSYTLTGNDAALIYTPLGGPTYTLVAEPGSYSLTGNDAALLASRLLTAEAGAYVLGGQDAVLLAGRRLAAEGGAYALTGNDAALIAARVLAAEPGAYALVGNAATLVYSGAEIPVTPDSRVFVVAAESRIYVIVLDDRTLVVPAESRTHAIRS